MKKLNLFTEEDLLWAISEGAKSPNGAYEAFNKMAREKLSVGYASFDTNSERFVVSVEREIGDIQSVHYITQPLEEEKVECDHVVHRASEGKWNRDTGFSMYYINNDFCPKCGKKLESTK